MYTYIEQFIDELGSLHVFKEHFTEQLEASQYLFERYTHNKNKIFKTTSEEDIFEQFPQNKVSLNIKENKFILHALNGVLTGTITITDDYMI